MRIFYDTEFIDDGKTIDLISIGAVSERGGMFYAVSSEFDAEAASPWVRDNVLTKLDDRVAPLSRTVIANRFLKFVREQAGGEAVELWADYAAYDHVVLAQLWGPMIDLPPEIPMFTHEFQQFLGSCAVEALEGYNTNAHNALADAIFLRDTFDRLTRANAHGNGDTKDGAA